MVFSISGIKREQIRGKIEIGNFSAVTPKLKSFSISKSRSAATSTLSASIQISSFDLGLIEDQMSQGGSSLGPVKLSVAVVLGDTGIPNSFNQLFQGFIRQVNIKRSFAIPGDYILDISCTDIMYLLENRTYSRRVKLDGLGLFSVITGVVRKGVGGQKTIGRQTKSIEGITRAGGRGTSQSGVTRSLQPAPMGPGTLNEQKSMGQKPFRRAKKSGGAASQAITAATGNDQLLVVPAVRILGVGNEETFRCFNCGEALEGDLTPSEQFIWEIVNPEVGKWVINGSPVSENTISDSNPSDTETPVRYRQIAFGDNTITLTSPSGLFGSADILGIPIHDHTSLGQGGPAFGVYATISSS